MVGPFFIECSLEPDHVRWELREGAVDGNLLAAGEASTWAAATYLAGQQIMDIVHQIRWPQ